VSGPKITRVACSPAQITMLLEAAERELVAGEPARARLYMQTALTKLADARAAQDQVLDEAARTDEVRAQRVVEPQSPGEVA
jgi:hypothetical protein